MIANELGMFSIIESDVNEHECVQYASLYPPTTIYLYVNIILILFIKILII